MLSSFQVYPHAYSTARGPNAERAQTYIQEEQPTRQIYVSYTLKRED